MRARRQRDEDLTPDAPPADGFDGIDATVYRHCPYVRAYYPRVHEHAFTVRTERETGPGTLWGADLPS